MSDFNLMEHESSTFSYTKTSRKHVIIAVAVAVSAFIIGIVIGRYAICNSIPPAPVVQDKDGVFLPGVPESIIKDGDLSIRDLLMESIDNKHIEDNLRVLTKKPHIAGSHEDEDNLVNFIKSAWEDAGFDSVQLAQYDILLSYPDKNNPNLIQILDGNDDVVHETPIEEDVLTPGKNNTEGIPPFNAYSPSGVVEGPLVYVNYGRVEDYNYLDQVGINVTGCVGIARYGKIFRGSKVDIAQRHGIIGLIMYSDPTDYAVEGEPVYPDSWWLPGSGAQRGTIFTGDGDPLTPDYPAIRTAYRYKEDRVEPPLPKIPAHPIGYYFAEKLLLNMTGNAVPSNWTGGINITYRHGPGYVDNTWKVRMNISTKTERRNTTNIIGFIKGAVEPDRYVMFGNHRDAWVYGAIDPSSGTAVMLEVARAMGTLVKLGKWRPRRTIIFCSWGSEEYGLLGSTEWVEQYIKNIKERTVAYLNIDIAVQGTNTLRSKTTPLLYSAMYQATQLVPNPNATETEEGRKTVYDTWLYNRPWKVDGKLVSDKPQMETLGSGSDYAPLLQRAGVTCVDFRYTYDKAAHKIAGYPLYHSQYETFYAVKNLIDKEFKFHQAVARVGAELARNLADSLIIPLNVSDYAADLETLRLTLDKGYGTVLREKLSNYDELERVIKQFDEEAADFHERLKNVDKNNPLLTRVINDQLMLLEKSFLDTNGLPLRHNKKHILLAENSNDVYAGSSFPGLVDLLFEYEKVADQEKRWEEIKEHFSVILFTIQSAASTLRDVISFNLPY